MHDAVEAKMNPKIRERLLSHSIGLGSAYYKPRGFWNFLYLELVNSLVSNILRLIEFFRSDVIYSGK